MTTQVSNSLSFHVSIDKRNPNLQSLKGMAIIEKFNRRCRRIRNGLSDLPMRRLIIKHVGYKRDCRHSLLPVAVINIRHIFLPCNSDKYFLVGIKLLLGFLYSDSSPALLERTHTARC